MKKIFFALLFFVPACHSNDETSEINQVDVQIDNDEFIAYYLNPEFDEESTKAESNGDLWSYNVDANQFVDGTANFVVKKDHSCWAISVSGGAEQVRFSYQSDPETLVIESLDNNSFTQPQFCGTSLDVAEASPVSCLGDNDHWDILAASCQ